MNPVTEATKIKHDFLNKFLETNIARWTREAVRLVFVEPTPGIGVCEDGTDGSPLILGNFLQNIWLHDENGKRIKGRTAAYFSCDTGREGKWGVSYKAVVNKFYERCFPDVHRVVLEGRSHIELPKLRDNWKNAHGMVFVDPCGPYPFNKTYDIVGDAKKMDILFNISSGHITRTATEHPLDDVIKGWRHWFITMPATSKQWVRLYGTEMKDPPGIGKMNMYDVNKSLGGETYRMVFNKNYNPTPGKERAKKAQWTREHRDVLAVEVKRLWKNRVPMVSIAKQVDVSVQFVSSIIKEK